MRLHTTLWLKCLWLLLLILNVRSDTRCEQVSDILLQLYSNTNDCDRPENCGGAYAHTFDNEALDTELSHKPDHKVKACGLNDRGNTNALWCPNPIGINKGAISFTWLRRDIVPGDGNILFPYYGSGSATAPQGMLFDLSKPNPLTLLCSYPIDARSNHRAFHGCGAFNSTAPQYCDNNLTSLTPQNYFALAGNPPDSKKMCSIKPENFAFYIQVSRKSNYAKASNYTDNEHLIKTWQGTSYQDIPIIAFFCVASKNQVHPDCSLAKQQARLFSNITRRKVPLVYIDEQALKSHERAFSPFSC